MQEHCKYLDTVAWNTLLKIIIPKYSKLAERIGPFILILFLVNSYISFLELFLVYSFEFEGLLPEIAQFCPYYCKPTFFR